MAKFQVADAKRQVGRTRQAKGHSSSCSDCSESDLTGRMNAEMLQILRLLDMRYAPSAVEMSARSLYLAGPLLTEVPEMVTGRLLATIAAATERWGIAFETIDHMLWPDGPGFWRARKQPTQRPRGVVPRPCQNGRKAAVPSGHPLTPRTAPCDGRFHPRHRFRTVIAKANTLPPG